MRRPAKGGTTHPTLSRPGMGFGRPLRARPGVSVGTDLLAEVHAFLRGEPSTTVDDALGVEERTPVGELDLRS
jgi:hypothetical protein